MSETASQAARAVIQDASRDERNQGGAVGFHDPPGACIQAANLTSIRMRMLRASEMGQIRDNFRQTQPCNGRMALPARQIDRSIPRLTVNKI